MKTVKNLFFVFAIFLLMAVRVGAAEVSAVDKAADGVQAEVSEAADSVQAAVEKPTEVAPAVPAAPAQPVAAPEPVKSEIPAGALTYNSDAAHSTVGFSVKHLQITNVKGRFADYTAKVVFDPNDLGKFKADVEIKVASINTDNEKRDEHLRSNDFFGVEQFPTITFKSDQLERRGEGYVMVGNLTMRGVTKQLTFPVKIGGPIKSPMGDIALGMSIETSINRQDYNISWNKKLDTGGYVLDDKVDLGIELELHQTK